MHISLNLIQALCFENSPACLISTGQVSSPEILSDMKYISDRCYSSGRYSLNSPFLSDAMQTHLHSQDTLQ